MLQVGVILLIIQLLFSRNIVSSLKANEEESNLMACASQIVTQYFIFSRTILITETPYSLDSGSSLILIDVANLHLLSEIEEKFNNVILNFNNVSNVNAAMVKLKDSYGFDSRSKYLVIVKNFQDIVYISNFLWDHRLYKSVILLDQTTGINIFQIDLRSNCGENIQPMKIGDFRNNTLNLQYELFNFNMKYNFHNCPLKITFSRAYPWINDNSSGIFVGILEIFAETNGFKLIYMPENPIYYEELQEGYSFETVYNEFERGYADIFLGLGNVLAHVPVETTTTVYEDNMYWAVPKAVRMPYWKAMVHYFPYVFWLTLLLMFTVICIIFCLVATYFQQENRFKDIVRNILDMFLIALNLSVPKLPKNRPLRTLVAIYCWISLLTCVVLQARLYDVFNNPVYENDVTDLDKLLKSGLPLKFSDGLALLFLFTGPQNQRVFDTYIGTNLSLVESLDKLITEENFATIVDTGVLVMRPNIRSSVNIFEIMNFQTVFYMKKYHELFEIFNYSIKKIVESGFVNKFVSDVRWKYFLKDRLVDENGFFRLALVHCQGAFMILVYGLLLATVVFVLELLCQYCQLKNKTKTAK